MATISENLQTLATAKANIKSAIEGKGQDLTDVPFTQYGEKISAIQSGGGTDRLQWKCDNMKSLAYEFQYYTGTDLSILEGLNTSQVTDISYMCSGCNNITEIPAIDTSNVENMSFAFSNNSKVTDFSWLNTENITNLYNTFAGCSSLKSLEVDTSKVTNMGATFSGSGITSLNLDLSNCTSATQMCQNTPIKTLTLSNTGLIKDFSSFCYRADDLGEISPLDLSSCTNFGSAFYMDTFGSHPLKEVHISNSGKVTNFSASFRNCSNLETIETIDLYSHTSGLSNMVQGCNNLTNLTVKNVRMSQLTINVSNLTVDSLVNTIKELWDYSTSTSTYRLVMATTNLAKLENVYVKLITPTAEQIAQDQYIESKMPCEVCESTDEGAMLITEYAVMKGWTLS